MAEIHLSSRTFVHGDVAERRSEPRPSLGTTGIETDTIPRVSLRPVVERRCVAIRNRVGDTDTDAGKTPECLRTIGRTDKERIIGSDGMTIVERSKGRIAGERHSGGIDRASCCQHNDQPEASHQTSASGNDRNTRGGSPSSRFAPAFMAIFNVGGRVQCDEVNIRTMKDASDTGMLRDCYQVRRRGRGKRGRWY